MSARVALVRPKVAPLPRAFASVAAALHNSFVERGGRCNVVADRNARRVWVESEQSLRVLEQSCVRGSREQQLASDPEGPSLSVDFLTCRGGSCLGSRQARVVGLRDAWQGSIQSFDPEAGSFAAEALSEDGFGSEVRVQAELHWTPMAP